MHPASRASSRVQEQCRHGIIGAHGACWQVARIRLDPPGHAYARACGLLWRTCCSRSWHRQKCGKPTLSACRPCPRTTPTPAFKHTYACVPICPSSVPQLYSVWPSRQPLPLQARPPFHTEYVAGPSCWAIEGCGSCCTREAAGAAHAHRCAPTWLGYVCPEGTLPSTFSRPHAEMTLPACMQGGMGIVNPAVATHPCTMYHVPRDVQVHPRLAGVCYCKCTTTRA